METVLLTGGSGYLGRKFLQEILSINEYRVISVVRKRASNYSVDEIESDVVDLRLYKEDLLNADYVVWFSALRSHFAAHSDLNRNNISPIQNIIPILSRSLKLKCFIYISSISAIDNLFSSKNLISDSLEPNPKTPYGLSKLIAENLIVTSGCPYIILRLPFMYGSDFKKYSHLWFWKKLNSVPIIKFKISKGRISLLHGVDLAKIIIHLIKDKSLNMNKRIYLISDGNFYSIDDILHLIPRSRFQFVSMDLSLVATKIYSLIPSKAGRYWSRILFDENFFLVKPSDFKITKEYNFINFRDGLIETYKK